MLLAGGFALGYHTGSTSLGKDSVDSLKNQVTTITSTVVKKSSELKHDLTLSHSLSKAQTMVLNAKEEVQQKNFGKAQVKISETVALLTKARAIPNTTEQIEIQIDNIRTRLLKVQNDVANLKPSVVQKITTIAEDITHLRTTTLSF
tara:strand:+ start:451 stop:891 length:441 start_codon:yes stop_codon:yes gene_type:complete